MKVLNVAEKNDVAKVISNLLSSGQFIDKIGQSKCNKIYEFKYSILGASNDMIMTSVLGHMMKLEFPSYLLNWETINPVCLFDNDVIKSCIQDSVAIKKSLECLVRDCDMLIIWTDCDREGENIGLEVVDTCLAVNPNVIVKRARFSQITIESVTFAIHNLVDINLRQSQAIDVRQELDFRSGAAFTRLQTIFLRKQFPQSFSNRIISFGSCQFPALGFVVARYKEIENFIVEPFWKICLRHEKSRKFSNFSWEREKLFNKDLVNGILENITDGGSLCYVRDVITKQKSKRRPLAMDTIEMEKLASRELGISAFVTMDIAEHLYNQGFISYPRTETNIFSKEMNLLSLVEAQALDIRWGEFSRKLRMEGISPHNGDKTDQTHPPIHPLKQGVELFGNEFLLFELITRHFLACLSKDAVGHETTVYIDCFSKSDENVHYSESKDGDRRNSFGEAFTLTGMEILKRNYLEVYPYEKWTDKEISDYEIGEIFIPSSVTIEEGKTSSPSLLTEADLVVLMDKHSIGTDTTHAKHIQLVKAREYISNTGPNLIHLLPEKLGIALVEAYDLMGLSLPYLQQRAEFEIDLQLICQGIKEPKDVLNFHLNEYKVIFNKIISHLDKLQEVIYKYYNHYLPQDIVPFISLFSPSLENKVRACPTCEGFVNIRHSKSNLWYLGCNRYPICRHAIWLPASIDNVIIAKANCTGHPVECLNQHDGSRNIAVNKISIQFSTFTSQLGNLFPDELNRFILCLYCDKEVCARLDVNITDCKALPTTSLSTIPIAIKNKSMIIKTKQENCSPIVNPCTNSNILSQEMSTLLPKLSQSVDQLNVPNCQCGLSAVVRKVIKNGPNTGKLFYTCSISSCRMFVWADSLSQKRNSTLLSPTKLEVSVPPDSPNRKQSIVLCSCGNVSKLLTVKKENQNKGRKFYTCSLPNGCNFFQWFDDHQGSVNQTLNHLEKRPHTFHDVNQPKKAFTLPTNL